MQVAGCHDEARAALGRQGRAPTLRLACAPANWLGYILRVVRRCRAILPLFAAMISKPPEDVMPRLLRQPLAAGLARHSVAH